MSSHHASPPIHPGDIYARSSERVAELRARYPDLFKGPFVSCSWPIGWHELVREVSAQVHEHAPHVRWEEIKEKDGGLCLYFTPMPTDPEASYCGRIRWAEDESLRTCVLCGDYGELNDGTPRARMVDFAGWWLTACARCEPLIRSHRATRGGGGG